MLKVAIFNFKGGTAKSTTTLNLGACLATKKRSLLLVDLDGQRTLSFGLGLDGQKPTALDWLQGQSVKPRETSINNLSLIPGDLGLFQLSAESDLFGPALAKVNQFDVCLMDCAPGLTVTSVQAILSCDRILVPVISEPAALKGLSEAVELVRDERPDLPIDVVRCRYRKRLTLTVESDLLLFEAAPELDFRLLNTCIPDNISVAESIAHQKPVTSYASGSVGAKAYKAMAKECVEAWNV
ncbi:ParA family protein [Laspinema sp. D1]|uniref:ParA family protein n=1 Tax=Laspinema palackyanum D2a TaxID=2953684 RepID=A0ABT2N1Y9_9CYAN|nr:ParA family protein [Laspinema sp. D2a]